MKRLFIPVKSNIKVKLPKELEDKKVGLVATVQYLDQLKELKGIYGGQVLGCNVENALRIKNIVDCYFLLSEGRFHALEIARKTGKDVYVMTGDKISKKELEDYKLRKLRNYNKFLHAKTIGILVSLKDGQNRLKLALELKKKIKKDCYIFVGDTFNLDKLEDFKGIDIFVNTACPRIEGKKIIQMDEIWQRRVFE